MVRYKPIQLETDLKWSDITAENCSSDDLQLDKTGFYFAEALRKNLPMQCTEIFSAVKIENFTRKILLFLDINCGYIFFYQTCMYVYPCIPQFYYIKVGFMGGILCTYMFS